MSENIRKTYGASDRAVIALEALKGNLTVNEITKKYGAHSTQIHKWKKQLKDGVLDIFSQGQERRDVEKEILIDDLSGQTHIKNNVTT